MLHRYAVIRDPFRSPFHLLRNWVTSCSASQDFVARIRMQHRIRTDDTECAKALTSEKAKFLLFHKGRPLLKRTGPFGSREPVLLTVDQLKQMNPNYKDDAVFLKMTPSLMCVFAVAVPSAGDIDSVETEHQARFSDLRAALFMVDSKLWSAALSQGFSMLRWKSTTRFCSACGTKLHSSSSGCVKVCPNKQQCGLTHHPSNFPVGIVLLTSCDHSKVLLARQESFPPGMYSCVAGFVDPGEDLQECIEREAAEELGVQILREKGLRVVGSQYWPYPSGSFMMGCMAYVDDDAVVDICSREIQEAKWFTAEQVAAAVKAVVENPSLRLTTSTNNDPEVVFVPPKGSIAHDLLVNWLRYTAA